MAGNMDSLSHKTIDGTLQLRGAVKVEELAGTGTKTLDLTYGHFMRFDAGGGHINVDFVAAMEVDGAWYHISNFSSGAENLVVRDSADSTIVTLNQNESAVVVYDGSAWYHMGVVTIAQT